jgi:DNA-binding NtrC family response regulator
MSKTILVVDDDPTQSRRITAILEREGYAVTLLPSGDALLDHLGTGAVCDLILLDLVMAGRSGLETLTETRARGYLHPVIVLTAAGGIDMVGSARQAGALDFFVKPASAERIVISVANALASSALRSEFSQLRRRNEGRSSFDDLTGNSPGVQRVRRLGERAARSSVPVLISGESGVGKEVIARAVHGTSDRSGQPFVAVNCSAIPAGLGESILFGLESSHFAGGTEGHAGEFGDASGGTLLLDEVGALSADLQLKLLRFLQDGEVGPVGARRPVAVDVRLIAATSRNLLQAVSDGAFREDLYFRLSALPIEAPPLRARKADIPSLVETFIRRFNIEEGRHIGGVSADALDLLMRYDWPGNIRQLENAVYRAMVLAEGSTLQPHDFPAISGLSPPTSQALAGPGSQEGPLETENVGTHSLDAPVRVLDEHGHIRTLEAIETDLIRFAIDRYEGQMSEAARRLGIGRSTLYRKVRE